MSITSSNPEEKNRSLAVKRRKFKLWPEPLVVAAFGLVAVVFTWPLVLHFGEAVPGDDNGDVWQMVWNLWWVRHALEHLQNPFQTDLIFYPQGTSLFLHALNPLNGFFSLPVQYLGGLLGGAAGGAVAGYNFIVLFSLTFAAYGAFCLARYLWQDDRAALVAGLAYGFSTYHFTHLLGHLNLVSSEFIPFYILFFLKALHPGPAPNGQPFSNLYRRLRLILPPVACLVALMLLELQYVLYMAIFSGLYLLYFSLAWLRQRWRGGAVTESFLRVGSQGSLIAIGFGLVSLPFSLPALLVAVRTNTDGLRQERIYSADALAYLYPSPFQPIWGTTIQKAIRPWTASLIEKIVFPGYTVYLLVLVGLVAALALARRKTRSGRDWQQPEIGQNKPEVTVLAQKGPQAGRPGPLWWMLAASIFGVLSFGPRLHLNGVEHGPVLPGELIYNLPILNISRVPSRFAVVTILALAILAAWGLNRLCVWWNLKPLRYAIVVGLVLLTLGFELFPAPYRLATYSVPEFYRQLAADPRTDYSLLEIPLNYGKYQYNTRYLEAQMTHAKPILNGYISRNPVFGPYEGVPTLQAFRDFAPEVAADILPAQPLDTGILRRYGVRYIVIRKDILRGEERAKAFEVVAKLLPGQSPVANSEDLAAYEVPPGPKTDFFYYLAQSSWYGVEKGPDGHLGRWVQGQTALLDFWTAQSRQLEIEFPLWSFHEAHSVKFKLGDRTVGEANAGLEAQTVRLKLDLEPGSNELSFEIGGRAYRPAELGLGPDTRWLSVGVGEIKINQ